MDINCFNVILAQAATPPAGQPQGSPFGLLVPMILVFVIMYFMMIRPQQKRAKQQAEMLKTLKSGDRVVTASGILGTVISVKDNTVSLRSADAKMEITKASVTEILQSSPATES
ncbi:MAG: preprotein translocase subunit YajC [Limisphaerales bacterium]